MTRPPDDRNFTDLIAGYVLDDLSHEEAARLQQILEEAPEHSEEVKSFEEALSLLPYDSPMIEPPPLLKDKILRAAAPNPTNVVPIAPIVPIRQRLWKQWIPAIGTGIAAIAVSAFSLNQIQQTIALQKQLEATNTELSRLRNELQANQKIVARLSNPNTQVRTLVGIVPNPINSRLVTARLLSKPNDREVTIVAQNLPQLPKDRIYRLWSIAKPSASPIYCGQFRQDGSGTARWIAPNAICTEQPSRVVITLDAPKDPITSAGPLVMQSLSKLQS